MLRGIPRALEAQREEQRTARRRSKWRGCRANMLAAALNMPLRTARRHPGSGSFCSLLFRKILENMTTEECICKLNWLPYGIVWGKYPIREILRDVAFHRKVFWH
jgi:hypothetical protein